MVIDLLDNIDLYRGLGPRIAQALHWVRDHDLTALGLGRHEIAGDSLFALVSEYHTKPQAEGRWEAHRKYLDLQCLAAGHELIGYAPLPTLSDGDYIVEKDISWHAGDGRFMLIAPGRFMLLWPGDGHMPGVAVDTPSPVRKVVLKIAV
ncbi:MAG: YhcH/YjgK/YiaL family protein [Vicinamibacterales bacterium]|nr:YhcH/YjgK/YiaL family protein [Vicinamibacterales bacterium]